MRSRVIDPDLIRKVRRLELATRRKVNHTLSGQYNSRFKGHGLAFAEVRPYIEGDPVRSIDWNVTARTGEPFVKLFHEERELTVMLLVDVSPSSDFGSIGQGKRAAAAQVVAQVALSAVANGDRVGLVLFSDRVEQIVPPRKGRKHALRLVADVLSHEPDGRGTDLASGLVAVLEAEKRTAVVFLISDFFDEGYDKALRLVARRHDLVPVVITDPVEDELPTDGLVALRDPETGEEVVIDSSDARVQRAYGRWMRDTAERRTRLFKRLQLDWVELHAGEDNGDALARLFHLRGRRGAA